MRKFRKYLVGVAILSLLSLVIPFQVFAAANEAAGAAASSAGGGAGTAGAAGGLATAAGFRCERTDSSE